MSLKIKKLILLFLFLLFLSSSTPVHGDTRNNQVGLQAQPQIEPTIYDPKTSNFYTDIDPIYITSNASFIPEGFSGSGTSTEPYVLENCRITNNTEPNLICIINTDAYFIIRNNFLDGINKSPIGIYLSNVINGVVETNTIVNTRQGIHSVGNSNSNVITNNTIKDNKHGITASSSHNSSYTNNNIFNNTGSGIYFEELYQPTRALSGNIITNNTIYDNDGDGIFIECGTNNLVMNNSIMNNFLGIDIIDGEQNTIYNNTIIGNKGGLAIGNGLTDVFLLYASSNISRNTIMHNEEGLAIYSYGQFESERGPNNVSKNIIIQNGDGLYVGSSNYTITENIVYNNNDVGIEIRSLTSGLMVKWNDFIGNELVLDSQAYDEGYHNTYSQNYWDDWTCPDDDADGIVDNPYPFVGDASPLTAPHNDIPVNLHLLSRPRLLYPTGGEQLKGTITVKWCSVTDFSGHSVTYTLYYSDKSNGPWEELYTELTTPEYEWDSTSIEHDWDSYLKVVAECSEGEISEYSLFDSFDIDNTKASRTHGWSFTILALTLCLLAFAARRKKRK